MVVDRLGANRLGPYGNTCHETHNFCRLAARSILFDQAMTRSTDLGLAYEGLWQAGVGKPTSLMDRMGERGVRSTLLTDEPWLENSNLSDSFDRVVPVQSTHSQPISDSTGETELAVFFAQAMELLNEREPGELCWLHSRGLSGAWDAPYELRKQLSDSDDPDPPTFIQPPSRLFDPNSDDPDDLLAYQQASAAQVVLIDDFLGVLLDSMETNPIWQSTLLCVLSTRGFPLGEHRLVGSLSGQAGSADEANRGMDDRMNLYNESIHVPMMVCFPHSSTRFDSRGIRNGSLIQPNWIPELLLDWVDDSDDALDRRWNSTGLELPNKRHEFTISISGEAQAIQTHAWKLIRTRSTCELYVKPDDLWEVNDVSRRCSQVVTELGELLDRCIEGSGAEERIELPEELSVRIG